MFTPLTQEQYTKAISAGFSSQQIIENEKKRKSEQEILPEKKGFWNKAGTLASDLFKGLTKPIIKPLILGEQTVQDVGKIGLKAIQTGSIHKGLTETTPTKIDLPYYGSFEAPKTIEEGAGNALETVSLGLSGPFAMGAAMMAGQAMQENKGALSVAGQGLLGGVFGKATQLGFGLGGKLLRSSGGFLQELGSGSTVLKNIAEEQYGKVLAPTTRLMKNLTQKIVPGLAERKVFSFSLKGLLSKAEQQSEKFGQQIESAWEKLPIEHKTTIAPIIETITNAQNKLTIKTVEGEVIPKVNEISHKILSDFKDEIIKIAGDENTPTRLLREYRQTLDAVIQKAGKGFGFGLNDSSILSGTKIAANAIREQLSKATPDIAKINNEFTFWKRIQDVIGKTIERKTGQATPLGQKIMKGAGIAAGLSHGGIFGAIEGGIIMKNLEKLTTSTMWNTFSASNKARLADLLAKGDYKIITEFLSNVVSGTGIVLEKTGGILGGIPSKVTELQTKNIPGTPEINWKGAAENIVKTPAGMSIKDVSKLSKPQGITPTILSKPFKNSGPLTTKILNKLEGRTEVSRQFISDLTNSGDLKQQERDLIREAFGNISIGTAIVGGGASLLTASAPSLLKSKKQTINNTAYAPTNANSAKVEKKIIPDEVKKMFAASETSGKTDGDWLQLEEKTFNELVNKGYVSGEVQFEDIIKEPVLYDIVAKGYLKQLEDVYGLKSDYDKALWSWRPAYFNKYKGDINKIPDNEYVNVDGQIMSKRKVMIIRKKLLDKTQ